MMRTAVAMADPPKIRVTAAAIVRDARVLLVRKSSGPTFIPPGGKPEPGESEPETLRREIHEELGCDIDNLDIGRAGHLTRHATGARARLSTTFGCALRSTTRTRSPTVRLRPGS
jgi:8-oxo-dGTP pyrophosphatase MutT (NUDIX family)